jgi:hypothetical protein
MNKDINHINIASLKESLETFKDNSPFDHCVVDNFFQKNCAEKLANEFIAYEDKRWFYYKNPIEDKKALNDWNIFPEYTYKILNLLCSEPILNILSETLGKKLYPDPGLHGGGWHMHTKGGNLNPHLDYSIHPKLRLERKLNIIIYLSKELNKPEYGGHLGLWDNKDPNKPGELLKEVETIFNRAIIFDTTQNSWHGMSRTLTQPEGIYRKSLAVYYLTDPHKNTNTRNRALFAPRDSQHGNKEVEDIIKLRSDIKTSSKVYKT